MTENELIEIGTTGRPHGISGELRFHIDGRYRDSLPGLERIFIATEGMSPQPVRIVALRPHNEVILACLEGAEDRTAAEALKGAALFASPEDLEKAGCPGPFPEQMIGMSVRTEAGERAGILVSVDEYPAGDMLVVEDGEREHLIPVVPEIVLSIDLESREIVIRPPAGLLDLSS